jgi:predicted 3-demethylubiquinone-9 3-methyltransferase (glyoxalase superfamily)
MKMSKKQRETIDSLNSNEKKMTQEELERYYNSCSKCGGEKDSEGWCANYCTNDDLEVR